MRPASDIATTISPAFSPTSVIREALTSGADRAQSSLGTRTYHSWKMALDRAETIADAPATAGAPGVDLFLTGGHGATAVDLDGNTLIDLCMGYGAELLGHGHPAVAAALSRQIGLGWQLGLPTASQLTLARLIRSAAPANERVAFAATGSDATLLTMRAARAITGRDAIAVFTGSFHGAHDYGLVTGEPDPDDVQGLSRRLHLSAGVPRAVDQVMTVLPYGHPAAFDAIRRRRTELAAVVVEAVRPGDPHRDAGSWLQELFAACRHAGVLVILDEVTTGFRLAYGGAQEAFGLIPDLVAYGKVVGGGLPLGAVAGRADLMAVFGGDAEHRGIFSASTSAGNPLSVAAGIATLEHALRHRETLYPALDAAAAQLCSQFAAAATELGVPAAMTAAGSMLRVHLGRPGARVAESTALRRAEDVFATHVLSGGVLMQAGLRGFLSAAHEPVHLARVLAVFATALREVKADGLFTPLA